MIVTSFSPEFLPALRQVKDLGLVALNQQFAKLLSDADIPTSFLGEYLTPQLQDISHHAAAQLLGQVYQQPVATANLHPTVAQLLEHNLGAYLYSRLDNLISVAILLDAAKPKLTLVHNDVEPLTRAVAIWSAARGVPCLHVPHAIYLEHAGRGPIGSDIHDLCTASHIAVAGPYQARWYIERGFDAHNVYLSGLPQFDRLAKPAPERDTICAMLRLDALRPVVTYASSWRQDTSLLGCHDGVEESYATFLAVARQYPEFQYIVKCHPRGNNLEWHRDEAQKAGVRCLVLRDYLEHCLAISDIFISYGASNVVLEAMAYGRARVLVLGDTEAFASDPTIPKLPADSVQLAAALRAAIQDTSPLNYNATLTKYLGPVDGNAHLRIAKVIRKLHGEPDAQPA